MDKDKFRAKLKSIAINMLVKKKDVIEKKSTEILQKTILELSVYDTGNLRGVSTAKFFVFSNNALIRLKTDGDLAPYWMFPRNGWGSSAKIGPRKYDLIAADKIKKFFKRK